MNDFYTPTPGEAQSIKEAGQGDFIASSPWVKLAGDYATRIVMRHVKAGEIGVHTQSAVDGGYSEFWAGKYYRIDNETQRLAAWDNFKARSDAILGLRRRVSLGEGSGVEAPANAG